jgi:hypothetical protein
MTFRKFSTAPGFLCRDLSAIAKGGRKLGSISAHKVPGSSHLCIFSNAQIQDLLLNVVAKKFKPLPGTNQHRKLGSVR